MITVTGMHAHIDQGPVEVLVLTYQYGHFIHWEANICRIVGRNQDGIPAALDMLAKVTCARESMYENHEDALAAGMSHFDGTREEKDFFASVGRAGFDAFDNRQAAYDEGTRLGWGVQPSYPFDAQDDQDDEECLAIQP